MKLRIILFWAMCGICISLLGQTNTWTGGAATTNWEDAGNWSLGVPIAAHDVAITGATVDINAGTNQVCATLNLSSNSQLTVFGTATLTIDGFNSTNVTDLQGMNLSQSDLINLGTITNVNSELTALRVVVSSSIDNQGLIDIDDFNTSLTNNQRGLDLQLTSTVTNSGIIDINDNNTHLNTDGIVLPSGCTIDNLAAGNLTINNINGAGSNALENFGTLNNSGQLTINGVDTEDGLTCSIGSDTYNDGIITVSNVNNRAVYIGGNSFINDGSILTANSQFGVAIFSAFTNNDDINVQSYSVTGILKNGTDLFTNTSGIDVIGSTAISAVGIRINGGTMVNDGLILVDNIAQTNTIGIDNNAAFSNNGTILLNDILGTSLLSSNASATTTNLGTITVLGSTNIGVRSQTGNITNSSVGIMNISMTGGTGIGMLANSNIVNNGSLSIDGQSLNGIQVASGGLFFQGGSSTVVGTATNGMLVDGGQYINQASGSLMVESNFGASINGIRYLSGATISDAGTYEFNDNSSSLSTGVYGTDGTYTLTGIMNLNDMGTGLSVEGTAIFNNNASGTINVNDGIRSAFYNQSEFNNEGSIVINNCSTTSGFSALRNLLATGIFTNNGSIALTNMPNTDTDEFWNLSNGTLLGSGTFSGGRVRNDATFTPGNSIGEFTITGDLLSNTVSSVIEIEFEGTNGPGVTNGHDRIVVSGDVDITNGTVDLVLLGGFVPSPPPPVSNCFDGITTGGTLTSGFATQNDPVGYGFVIVYEVDGTVNFCDPIILPVATPILELDYNQSMDEVVLSWTPIEDWDNYSVTVYHSINGFDFEKIGQTNSNETQFLHALDPTKNDTEHYYRLAFTQLEDQTQVLSNIEFLRIQQDQDLHFYPNPIASGQRLNIMGDDVESISIFNSIGQLVYQNNSFEESTSEFDLPELSNGTYYVMINATFGQTLQVLH